MGATVIEAKSKIFQEVCRGYKRSRKPDFAVRAQEVRVRLNIPPELFGKALEAFVHGHSQMHIEVFIKNSERYLRLGPTGKSLCMNDRNPF